MCLAQGHNAVRLVRLKLTAPLSQVKHSTTEPLLDLLEMFSYDLKMKIALVKVFRIIPEFRILRLTFHRKSASKC